MAGLVAHIFVSTVGAVFNSVTSLAVGDDFLVGADEVGLGAGAGGVVAGGGRRGSIDSVEGEAVERHDRDDESEENDVG